MECCREYLFELLYSSYELSSKCRTFTFAAMDTTSLAVSRILWILSQYEDVQDKLFREISNARKAKEGGDLTYDELVNLPYLDAVCRETLRLLVCNSFFFQPWINMYRFTVRYPPASLAMRAYALLFFRDTKNLTLFI